MDIWTFFTLICYKNCIVGLKRPQINEKEAGVGPFFKKNHTSIDATKLECLSVTLLPTQASKIFDTEKQVLGVNKNCVNKTPIYCPSGILFVSQINESKIVGSNPLDTRETEDESKS